MKTNQVGAALSAVVAACILSACGGGGGSSNPAPSNPTSQTPSPAPVNSPVISTTQAVGVFLDAPVVGLTIKHTDGRSQVTGAWGQFTYRPGESIDVYLGSLKLGTILAKAVITPLDLFSTQDVTAASVTNLLRLLQTLDADSVTANGINLSAEVLANARDALQKLDLNLTVAQFEASSDLTAVLSAKSAGLSLLPATTAQTHFQSHLTSAGKRGVFSGSATLPSIGTIAIEGTSNALSLFAGRYLTSNSKMASINLGMPDSKGMATLQVAGYESVDTSAGKYLVPVTEQDSGPVTLTGDVLSFKGSKGYALNLNRMAAPATRSAHSLYGSTSQAVLCANGTFTLTVSSGYGINAGQYSGLVYVSDTGLKYALASTFSFGNAVFQTGNVTVNSGSVKFDLPSASLELPFVKSGSYMSGC